MDYYKNRKPDLIVSIASGGFEPAFVVSKLMNLNHETLMYSHHYRHQDKVKVLPFQEKRFMEKVPNREILLIDDWIESGRTINRAIEFLRYFSPRKIDVGIVNSGTSFLAPRFPFMSL
jgi:hypoxanthine phosphoribosyltransferase